MASAMALSEIQQLEPRAKPEHGPKRQSARGSVDGRIRPGDASPIKKPTQFLRNNGRQAAEAKIDVQMSEKELRAADLRKVTHPRRSISLDIFVSSRSLSSPKRMM